MRCEYTGRPAAIVWHAHTRFKDFLRFIRMGEDVNSLCCPLQQARCTTPAPVPSQFHDHRWQQRTPRWKSHGMEGVYLRAVTYRKESCLTKTTCFWEYLRLLANKNSVKLTCCHQA
ncbi:uncharacterized protein LOC143443738 isoform X2 [Arvicanthis niloticus]|uniref:uncharacterized protein LOC143314011 n=1 Tax=Arvicanthis niloticus TaxID=61156 RepID=UPI00402B3BE8